MAEGNGQCGDFDSMAPSQEDVIRFQLETFLPYIVDCVEATDILVHMHYFNREQRKEIFQESVTKPHAATRKAIDIIMNETEDPGRFTAFKDMAKESDSTDLVWDIYIPNDENYKKVIDLFLQHIIARLNPKDLLPDLIQNEVLLQNEAEMIRAEEQNHGKIRASWLLLHYLPCRVENWFKYFLISLMECGLEDLAEMLDPDLYEKIKVQRSAETYTDTCSNGMNGEPYVECLEQVDDIGVIENIMKGKGEGDVDFMGNNGPDNLVCRMQQLKFDIGVVEKDTLESNEKFLIDKTGDASDEDDDNSLTDAKYVNNLYDTDEENSLSDVKLVNTANIHDNNSLTDAKLVNTGNIHDNNSLTDAKLVNTGNRHDNNSLTDAKLVNTGSSADNNSLTDAKLVNTGSSADKNSLTDAKLVNTGNRHDNNSLTDAKLVNTGSSADNNSLTDAKLVNTGSSADKNSLTDAKLVNTGNRHDNNSLTDAKLVNTGSSADNNSLTDAKLVNTGSSADKNSLTDAKLVNTGSSADNHSLTDAKPVNTGSSDGNESLTDAKPMNTGKTADNTSLTDVRRAESGTGGIIKYDRKFLLACRNSPLANFTPPEVVLFPEIRLPITLPRETGGIIKYDRKFLLACRNSPLASFTPPEVELFPEIRLPITLSRETESNHLNAEEHEIIYRRQNAMARFRQMDFNAYNRDEELELNIKTDEDKLDDVEDEDFSLRDYQTELSKEGVEGENVIIMAPTNSGKTRVAFKIMQEHFRKRNKQNKIAKVIFLVENEALANQQGEACAELLLAYRTKVISGSSQRDKRQYLRDFISRRDILVVTAQVLVNALKDNDIESLAVFSMIVFDECHHTNDQHPYNQIMSRYLDLKLDRNVDFTTLPQIVGLTASLSAGGNMQEAKAQLYMKQVMANLNASCLCTVRRNRDELKIFENPPYEEIVTARGRQDDVFSVTVNEAFNKIDRYMTSKSTFSVPASRGTEQFIQWLSALKEAIAELRSEDDRRLLNACRHHLEVYNKCLLIHKDARVKDGLVIVDDFMDEVEGNPRNDETDEMLINIYRDLKTVSFDEIPENPKLLKMQELVLNMLRHEENARCIIFVKTRELAKALVAWMHETEAMKPLNATEFVGQSASASKGGMTKSRQQDALVYFKDGRHKVIIATSVAEEGLDITKCNLVMRYEHVTNEIVRLQSRGRARAPNSRYYVLTQVGSWIILKEEKNAELEKLMNRIIPVLQQQIEANQNQWVEEMRKIQEEFKIAERLKEANRLAQMTDDAFELQCFNCGSFICMSGDIKKIQNSHHVIIDEEVNDRILLLLSVDPQYQDDDLKYGGATLCKTCMYNLGGVCEYKSAEFPLIKISQFRVVNKRGQGSTHKKWKKVKFNVAPFTLDDLRTIVEQRLAA